MTRPEAANTAFADALPAGLSAHLRLVSCPLIAIAPVVSPSMPERDFTAIFTSANGVRFAPPGKDRKAFCVGAETTRQAFAAGWQAVCAGQNAQGLIARLLSEKPVGPLRHLCGVHVRGRIVETLMENGFDAGRIVLYDQELLPLSGAAQTALSGGNPVIVPLFSPRAAAHFAASVPEKSLGDLLALSPAVAEAAGTPRDFRVRTASQPTLQAMISEIEKSVEGFRLA